MGTTRELLQEQNSCLVCPIGKYTNVSAKTAPCKKKGSAEVIYLPTINGCMQCFQWFLIYVKYIMTWAVHAEKLESDPEYRAKIRAAKETAKDIVKRAFDPQGVSRVNTHSGTLDQMWVCLNEAQLMKLSNKTYLPGRVLTGPTMQVPKLSGAEGMETVWVFEHPTVPWRVFKRSIGCSIQSSCEFLNDMNHVWEQQSAEVAQKAIEDQVQLDTSGSIGSRHVALPSLNQWLEKATEGVVKSLDDLPENVVAPKRNSQGRPVAEPFGSPLSKQSSEAVPVLDQTPPSEGTAICAALASSSVPAPSTVCYPPLRCRKRGETPANEYPVQTPVKMKSLSVCNSPQPAK